VMQHEMLCLQVLPFEVRMVQPGGILRLEANTLNVIGGDVPRELRLSGARWERPGADCRQNQCRA